MLSQGAASSQEPSVKASKLFSTERNSLHEGLPFSSFYQLTLFVVFLLSKFNFYFDLNYLYLIFISYRERRWYPTGEYLLGDQSVAVLYLQQANFSSHCYAGNAKWQAPAIAGVVTYTGQGHYNFEECTNWWPYSSFSSAPVLQLCSKSVLSKAIQDSLVD